MNRIYLDNNATTFLAPEIVEKMQKELLSHHGNPSSVHSYGQESRHKLNKARKTVADFFQRRSSEIIFTSGATEAITMLMQGFCSTYPKGHVITSNVEHSSVTANALELERKGWQVSYLPAGLHGVVQVDAVEQAICKDTRLIVLMAANNETGVKLDLEAIAACALSHKIPLIVDAVALFGKEDFSIFPGVSAFCVSGHKIHAPKGVGVACVRPTFKWKPLILGGGQEFGMRSGTENLLGIIAFSKACELLRDLDRFSLHMKSLRDLFEEKVLEKIPEVKINGTGPRVCNTVNFSFTGLEGDALLMNLDLEGVCVSHGSACSAGSLEPSRVLLNMGIPRELVQSSLRFSFSRYNTEKEVHDAVKHLERVVQRLRSNALF